MLIKVKTLTGKELDLDVSPEDKVIAVKRKIEEKEAIPPEQQRLIYGGRQMQDENTIESFKIEAGTVLHLVLALRGGSNA